MGSGILQHTRERGLCIAQAIQNGIAVAASDGSYDEATGIATSGYQLCAATMELQFDNSSLVLTNLLEKQRINPHTGASWQEF
jgi:hypothetical protein